MKNSQFPTCSLCSISHVKYPSKCICFIKKVTSNISEDKIWIEHKEYLKFWEETSKGGS